eukprot:15049-Eustigmatos_ZCMA.PRE.1
MYIPCVLSDELPRRNISSSRDVPTCLCPLIHRSLLVPRAVLGGPAAHGRAVPGVLRGIP